MKFVTNRLKQKFDRKKGFYQMLLNGVAHDEELCPPLFERFPVRFATL